MLCSLIILLFANCGGRSRKANDKASETQEAYVDMAYPIEIDVRKKYDREALNIENIADVEYIPLETGKDILLSNVLNGLSVSDSLLITINQQGTVFIFDIDGRLKSQFNHTGKGPNEYRSISKIAVDFDKKDI